MTGAERRSEADTDGACGDGAERYVGGRHREVIGVVLSDSEEVDADLVGEDALFDDVPDRLRMREREVVFVMRDVAERVEAEHERSHVTSFRRRTA
jgi:hypothetical protein